MTEPDHTDVVSALIDAFQSSELDCHMWAMATLKELANHIILSLHAEGLIITRDTRPR
jgi:hypothetical protein